jgi:UDP-4-amino-4,6-dideoxy-N-acetyl-beta-L-altrosamine N-acetyltransferase
MLISKGNIVFRRLTHSDIELVRKQRNSNDVSQFMEYKEIITPEMQEKWFKSIDNIYNLYFIIEYKGEKIGLINGRDIDWDNNAMETGIFIWDKNYLNTHIPMVAVLIFGELGVMTFGLTAYARILKTNHRAKRYNKLLGFKLCEGQEEKENQLYKMTKETYISKSKFIRGAFLKLVGTEDAILEFEEHDNENGFADLFFNKLNNGSIAKITTKNGLKTLYFKSQ